MTCLQKAEMMNANMQLWRHKKISISFKIVILTSGKNAQLKDVEKLMLDISFYEIGMSEKKCTKKLEVFSKIKKYKKSWLFYEFTKK